jgi:methionyl-tRNA synthetase
MTATNTTFVVHTDELSTALRFHLELSALRTSSSSVAHQPSNAEKALAATAAVQPMPAPLSSTTMTTTTAAYDRWTLRGDNRIDFGYLGPASRRPMTKDNSDRNDDNDTAMNHYYYYITTAINYTNGPAHMGHAYEAVTADVLARFHRSTNNNHYSNHCYFVTGSDEHGQKIAAAAAAEHYHHPLTLCDKYVTGFQVLNQRALISADDYIRTTSDRHVRTAQELWRRCAADIYLDTYSGWYNEREEMFVTDSEAALADYNDVVSGLPLKRVQEESYFFKMSAYRDRLLAHVEQNEHFIRPEQHRQLILQRLRTEELRDLSISRTTFSWGVPVPEGFDQRHVMYVWVDALSNYLTGVDALGVNQIPSDSSAAATAGLELFWPANVHIIGKDILWFHAVIWPCLLMSANIPLFHTVFAHGFVNDKEGKKMSKSMGNVVDPHDMLDKFEVDTFRWYVCVRA